MQADDNNLVALRVIADVAELDITVVPAKWDY